ncbi:MAG: cobalt ABC transporter permease [Nitrospirota bacterium]
MKLQILTTMFLTLCALFFAFCSASEAADWAGVDESVVEKYAEEHGRAPVDPLINTDQGDLLLFMFLLGGAVGGFIAGYYWRSLTEGKDRNHLKNAANKKQAETTDGRL